MKYYEVASLRRGSSNDSPLTYQSESDLAVGSIVKIPFGKQTTTGVVTAETHKPDFDTKPIGEVIHERALSKPLVDTLLWTARYYASPLNAVFSLAVPKGIEKKRRGHSQKPVSVQRPDQKITLTKEQQLAIENIAKNHEPTHLLHGVTGSGKTRVYIELVRKALEKNTSALVLVPEISLTTQIVGDFQNEFDNVIVTHSGLTESQRHAIWNKIADSEKPLVIIGPRSALFTPVKSVGLIAIDESHEGTYKQDTAPRYDARRVARVLASAHKAPLVLGSATPTVVDHYLAHERGMIHRLHSPISKAAKPEITVVDNTNRDHFTNSPIISNELLTALKEAVGDNKQSLIFHNRRGTATIGLCSNCGWTAECPNCEVPMTLHKDTHELKCHICGHAESPPQACPDCGNADILFKGYGTKRVAEEINKLLPAARIIRFDADNTKEETRAQQYQAVHDGEFDVIVGTQIVAKGLDLPKLKAVGVTAAESSLHLPDYAAAERTYQLLTQVIGRAGRRDDHARVVLQSHQPDSPLLSMVIDNDY